MTPPRPANRPPFGLYMQGQRERLELSQAALARRAGLSQSLISRLEDGHGANPSAEAVARIASVLRLDAAQALNGCLPLDMSPVPGTLRLARLTDAVRAAGAEVGACSWDVAEAMYRAMVNAADMDVIDVLPDHLIPRDIEDDYDDTYCEPDRT